MKNLIYYERNGAAFIGEIVAVKESGTITVLSQHGRHINLVDDDRDYAHELTEEIYNGLNDYGKRVVDNWGK